MRPLGTGAYGTVSLEREFDRYRSNIVGIDRSYPTPSGEKRIVYLDWIASGRLYGPIERLVSDGLGPFVGNTHTESSETGTWMTQSYRAARELIKRHVHAGPDDILLSVGFGMTAAVNKLQRIMGLKGCGELRHATCVKKGKRPVVFVTHMEHHSNQTSWYETSAEVVVLEPDGNLLVDPARLEQALCRFADRELLIGSFTACSNVTGIMTPYRELAKIMHRHGGLCFVDFAASAPYVEIDMHPSNSLEKLDAIFLSPHKFLGGPGSSGIVVFDRALDTNPAPDQPGGGTVDWTNPWGEYKYVDDIEMREDGGTPGFLQTIRAALSVRLKEEMGIERMRLRERELYALLADGLASVPGAHILADHVPDRLGIVSFFHDTIHYNLFVVLLSDRYGIQVRGGCVCAGTYGHYLLHVDHDRSRAITERITSGDRSAKPGWVRISLHPTTTDDEVRYCIDAIREIVRHHGEWEKEYRYDPVSNEFVHEAYATRRSVRVRELFETPLS